LICGTANNKCDNFPRPEERRGLSGELPKPQRPLCRDLPSEERDCIGGNRGRDLAFRIHNIRLI